MGLGCCGSLALSHHGSGQWVESWPFGHQKEQGPQLQGMLVWQAVEGVVQEVKGCWVLKKMRVDAQPV